MAKNETAKFTINLLPLTLVLAILKWAGVIKTGWLWVLCPLWIPYVLALSFMLVFGVLALILGIVIKKG